MKIISLLLALIIISTKTYSQSVEFSEVDAIFSEWDNDSTPGCGLGIIQDGKLIYGRGYGLANLEYNIPNSKESVFRIASTSKQFTAACIILLAEEGSLSLEDKLSSFFPDFPSYADTITVKHLLNHTSGIRDYLQLSYLKGIGEDDYYQDSDIMSWLVNQKELNFSPGEEHLYSNSGYWLLGQIANKVSGMNMAVYAQQKIFVPLGMTNTHFHNDHKLIVKNRASGYYPNQLGGFDISMTTLDMIGDGGIFTTIEDIKKWDDSYYESDVLSEYFWKMMTTPGELNNGKKLEYASGLAVYDYKGLEAISHGGAFVGFRAELLRFPEHKFSIAIFTNRGDADPSGMAYQVADIFLKDKYKNEPEVKTIEEPTIKIPEVMFTSDQMEGNYQIQPGLVLEITANGQDLNVVQSWNKSAYKIVKSSGNTYEIPEQEDLSFTFSDLQSGATQICTIPDTVLSDFAGKYYSSELDVEYTITEDDKALIVKVGRDSLKINQSGTDIFSAPLGTINFQRSEGKITGFELDSGRVKNVQFWRVK